MRHTKDYIFFYSNKDYLSNFYPSSFQYGLHRYSCVEQYIMAQKALLFNDLSSFKLIMTTQTPLVMKRYGRKVKNFQENTWRQHRNQILYNGLLAKFTQNKHLQLELIKTCNKTLVEASPRDCIYGVGLSEHDDRILDPTKWRGQNLLGKTLMLVRSTILHSVNTQ